MKLKFGKNDIILLLIVFCIFEDYISSIVPSFKYYDEILAFFAIPIFLHHILSKNFQRLNYRIIYIISLLILFFLMGVISYFINSLQPFAAFLGDVFLNLKFFFVMYLGYSLWKKSNGFIVKKWLNCIRILTYGFATLIILNFLFNIFENNGVRFGLPVTKLFYSHSGHLASASTVLLLLTFRLYKSIKYAIVLVLTQILIIFVTFRYKAMVTSLIFLLLFFIVVVKKSTIKFRHYILFFTSAVLISWDQISLYYGALLLKNARGALTITSIRIATDLFPLGAGFGTFGSYMTRVYYSNYYRLYGINSIHGLSEVSGDLSFISDTFWPMIIGQTGYIGLLSYIGIIIVLYKLITKFKKIDLFIYLSCFSALIYLLIESTSSSAFVSPQAIPVAMWIGILIADSKVLQVRNINIYS